MKIFIGFLLFIGSAVAQCGPNGTFIGIGKAGDILCTGKTGAAGYTQAFTGVTGLTITAATHGQGTKPVGFCYDDGTPRLAIAMTSTFPTVAANGDIVFAWSGSKNGYCLVSALGNSAGAAGAGGGGSITDFTTTKTSGTVISVTSGTYRYGTNVAKLTGPFTFTLQTVAISSIVTGSTTTINVTPAMTNLVDGQAINVQLTGTGDGCAAGTGVFVAAKISTTQFIIPADTSATCMGVSGTVGAQTGGTAIIFGNSAGQIEMSHSAAMGALVSATGASAVVGQTSTGAFPNGSVPLASATVAVGAFDTVTDLRSAFAGMQVQSGPGIDVTMVGGQAQVGVASNVALVDAPSTWVNSVIMKDAAKTLPWRSGSDSPNARDNCSYAGEAYFRTDTPALWACIIPGTPGTWAKVGTASSSGTTLLALDNAGLLALDNAALLALVN